jgi:hypothetical protein
MPALQGDKWVRPAAARLASIMQLQSRNWLTVLSDRDRTPAV